MFAYWLCHTKSSYSSFLIPHKSRTTLHLGYYSAMKCTQKLRRKNFHTHEKNKVHIVYCGACLNNIIQGYFNDQHNFTVTSRAFMPYQTPYVSKVFVNVSHLISLCKSGHLNNPCSVSMERVFFQLLLPHGQILYCVLLMDFQGLSNLSSVLIQGCPSSFCHHWASSVTTLAS